MWIKWITPCNSLVLGTKNPHRFVTAFAQKDVDKVDNLFFEEVFADFIDVSGPHSYQQITVDNFF